MIDIFIDDDNKVTIKTTNGLAETEVATAIEESGASCFIDKL